ncbi:hypothetical protein PF005_g19407 [Phytophthora fragariae]|uniref:FYVE-type domain-containing protein n=1 Tax=Phytophthora fragariae TaxID=53985 RepID=A0A6A3E6Y3_9STRA|nr:hypothetical protein PF009_g20366 [Phytophthora fragariae]KAE9089578.1 hypothetical protein PF007_g19544 [Phytophthora fragariae]KAE9119629.1 hypothetical protein PF006_g18316 [Phytophthora fragariae]KAE9190050.1 hypothetical protein PF005_g19407 [Phytophthora fragariae]KAE9201684.1 hypothetical protein PF004_g18640 [Phytophthora fragariae]
MASSVPAVQFSAQRRAQLDRQCNDLIDRALAAHHNFHSSQTLGGWQRVRRRNAMNVYRRRAADSSRPRVLLGSGIVPGTLDDALSGVYCDSTESLRICKSLLSDNFVDGAVLRVFEASDLRAPIVFAGIKWFVVRGFAGTSGLLGDKDMLTYERMGRIVDRSGQFFAYHVLQSIDLPERPANRERGVQRVDVSWCYLYRQLSPDWLGVFTLGDMNLSTMIPQSISSFIAAERVLSAGNFLRCARAKLFSALMAGSSDGIPEQGGAPHCTVCLSPPPKMLGFAHKLCMGCRQKVCRKCRQRRYVFRLQLRSAKPATEYFCRLCVDKVTRPGGAKSSAGLEEVHDVLCRSGLGSSRSGETDSGHKAEWSGASKSGFHGSMRLDKLAEFARRCHDSIAMEEEGITWNEEELLEISQFLESMCSKSRRRERRHRSGSAQQTTSSQTSSRRRHWSGDNSSSSATSNGLQESPLEEVRDGYDYSTSPTADHLDEEESRYFENQAVESGPWTECGGKWTLVFDEDRQEHVRIHVPGVEPELGLSASRVQIRPKAVCIDELD